MAAPRRPSLALMESACIAFNNCNPVGSKIKASPRAKSDPLQEYIVAEPGAYVMGGHTAVVQCVGKGCIALSHVRPALAMSGAR